MTQSDDPSWRSNEADRYAVETCLTDVQANRLIDEVFAEVEAETPIEFAAVLDPHDASATTVLVPYEPLAAPHSTAVLAPERSHKLHLNTDFSWRDRFLMGVGIASFVLSVGLWISGARQPTAVVAPEVATTPAADIAFAEYLQTSLQLLSQQPSPTPATTIASATVPPSAPSPTVERIYVPIYQPPNAPAVSVPQLPTVTAPSPMPTDTVATAPIAPPAPQHTLVGVLELGERSVALIQTNGETLRLSVGDSVGNDGWQLVQIQNQRAVFRRQGEVRSLAVGQSL
ncbi:hypothetical protein L5220_00110 [Synechococcus sp. PCC 6716]|nr:hypothetical protein [Synechococcus sp. PCC 6716]